MSANQLLTLLMQGTFILLSIVTIADYLRGRNKIRRDIALMFSSLGLYFLLQIVTSLSGTPSKWINIVGLIALVSQPYLLLRLVEYFSAVPKTLTRIAVAGWLVSSLAFLRSDSFSQSTALIALIAIIIYFVIVDGYAATMFVRGVITTTGVVRQRLRFAAVGSGFLALAFLDLAIGGLVIGLRDVFTPIMLISAIASALAFYIGFAPPRWLRRTWQFAELRQALVSVFTKPVEERLDLSKNQKELCHGAVKAVGGAFGAIALPDNMENCWLLHVDVPDAPSQLSLTDPSKNFQRAAQTHTPMALKLSDTLTDEERQLLEKFGVDTVLIASIATPKHFWGLLLVFLRHSSLFLDDDLEMISLLAQQNAIFLENASLFQASQEYSGMLEKRVQERTQELLESQTRYRRIVETAQEGIWVTDSENITQFVNPRLGDMLGYSVEEMIGQPGYIFVDEEFQQVARLKRERRDQGIQEQYELKLRRKDGSAVYMLVSATPLKDETGNILGSMALLADITERRRAEEQLRILNTELERRVAERTTQLEATNKELEAFSYSVSHDLRAPLRSIDGFSQALLEDYADQLDVEGQSYLRRVRAAAQRMAQLIDDLLKLSQITRADLKREPVDLKQLSGAIADELQKNHPTRQVTFIFPQELPVSGDPYLLQIALENLIGNAWKFTSKKDTACIEVGVLADRSPCTYFVRDDGSGFDMTYAHKLFGAFQRLHGITDFEGTGIGLATVQRIIHRHGGRIWAEAKVGEGATFYFTLEPEES